MDAVPGRVNTVWFAPTDAPGVHDIQCREYCGLIHYNMRGTLICGGTFILITLLSQLSKVFCEEII